MNGFPLTIRKQPSGESFWIHVEPNYRVSTCKQKIQRMRGIPGNNIRLAIPSDSGSETSVSLTGDDFQQRTLASLGLVGSDTTDSESDEAKPTLEISPITIYVQTPTGRRIKLKDSIDVEAMVDTLEEMVTEELESAHLLEASESSEERFRLYHDRMPMRRGNPITRYKIKHMDVLKLKFGTDEADANQKQERRKAYQKLERKKTMRKSESAGNLRKTTRNQRSSSSSPLRGAKIKRDNTPKKQRLSATASNTPNSNGSVNRRNQLRKTPSNDLLKRLSQSLTSIRTASFSPLRGLVRANSSSSEQHQQQQPQTNRRKLMKARRDGSPSSTRSRSRSRSGSRSGSPTGSIGGRNESKPRRHLKKKTEEERSQSGRRRSQSTNEARQKAGRSKSRGGTNRIHDPNRRRKKSNGQRRSRSATKSRSGEESTELRKRLTNRSRSCSRGRDDPRNQSGKNKSSAGTKSHSERARRSRSGPRKSSHGRRTPTRIIPVEETAQFEAINPRNSWKPPILSVQNLSAAAEPTKNGIPDSPEKKKQMEEVHPRKSWKRASSVQNLPESKNDSIPDSPEKKKQLEEVHPRKNWKRASSAQNLLAAESTSYSTPEAQGRKKQTEEAVPRKAWKPASQTSSEGIPDAFRISIQKLTKPSEDEKEEGKKGHSPPSPVCVLSETLDMSQLVEENSQGSSDIQSDETEIGVYTESTDDEFESKRRENQNQTNISNKPKRMTLQQLKEAKSKEAEEAKRVPPVGTKSDNSSKTDSCTDSSEEEKKDTSDNNRLNLEESKVKRRLTNLRDLIETSEKNRANTGKFNPQNSICTADFTSSSETSTIKPLSSRRTFSREPSVRNIEEEVESTDTATPSTRSIVDRVKAKFEENSVTEKDSFDVTAKEVGVPRNQTGNHSVVSKFKAKFESPSPQASFGSMATKPMAKSAKDDSSDIAVKECGTERTPKENTSSIRLTRAKFEKESKAPEAFRLERKQKDEKHLGSPKESSSSGRKSRNSTGLPEKVITELKDTLHGNDDGEKSASVEDKEVLDKSSEVKESSVQLRAKNTQSFGGLSIRPLRPSSKDTPRSYANDGSVAKAAAEAMSKLDASIVDEIKREESSTKTARKSLQPSLRDGSPVNSPASTEASMKDRISKFQSSNTTVKSPGSLEERIGKYQIAGKDSADSELPEKIQTGGKENTNAKSPGSIKDRMGKFQTGGKENKQSPEPMKERPVKTGGKENVVAKPRGSIKDRVGKFQTGGKENTKSTEPIKGRPGKIETGGKENTNAKPRGSIKDRIGKFQTGEKASTKTSGFQMIGLATLGLKNAVTGNSEKKDDDSASTTYSFFCSNDDMTNDGVSDYDSSDFDDSDNESDEDSDTDGEFESIHVIGPDLTPFEITLESDSETVGNIKEAVAEAAGIPINELRLSLQNEGEIDESCRTHLTDDFKLSPGDILTVQPSTVVVKLPDGKSKLELSVFPGTLLSDIKEYIAESTGTTPSRQLLYNFEKNFDEELEDDLPVSADCTLRLTVY